jgi:hypothetical protein
MRPVKMSLLIGSGSCSLVWVPKKTPTGFLISYLKNSEIIPSIMELILSRRNRLSVIYPRIHIKILLCHLSIFDFCKNTSWAALEFTAREVERGKLIVTLELDSLKFSIRTGVCSKRYNIPHVTCKGNNVWPRLCIKRKSHRGCSVVLQSDSWHQFASAGLF